jgi:hypothetical protein
MHIIFTHISDGFIRSLHESILCFMFEAAFYVCQTRLSFWDGTHNFSGKR